MFLNIPFCIKVFLLFYVLIGQYWSLLTVLGVYRLSFGLIINSAVKILGEEVRQGVTNIYFNYMTYDCSTLRPASNSLLTRIK